jgi:hypothetical protein
VSVPGSVTPIWVSVTLLGESLPGPLSAAQIKGVRGYGAEAWGDPFGAGGPLSVVAALAVAGQTVRVVFNEEPAHFSPASVVDALNASNYALAVVSGQGEDPQPLGVDATPHLAGEAGVGAGQWGFDVRLDRSLALGLRYRVEATRIVSRAGLGMGFTYGCDFMGIVPPRSARPRARRSDLADFATDPATGAWSFEGGDVALAPGEQSYRTRVVRRATTFLDSFTFLRDYGTRVKLKDLAGPADLMMLQQGLRQQIRREPETQDCAVSVSLVPLPGILTVNIQCKTRKGAFRTNLTVQADGTITIH